MIEVNFSYDRSIPAVSYSAVIWVLAMISQMPISSIDMMSRFVTVPRAPITTGMMAVSTWWILFISNARSCYFSTFQSSFLTTLKSPGTVLSLIVNFRIAFSTRIISGMLSFTAISVCTVRSQYNSFHRSPQQQQVYADTTCLTFPVYASCTIPNELFWQHCHVFFCTVSALALGNHYLDV